MKTKLLLVAVALGIASAAVVCLADEKTPTPQLGVRVDPIPNLLAKHLRLAPDHGLLIRNIKRDSPADQAGLEKDDLILSFQGRPIESYEQFVTHIRELQVGDVVELGILHNGREQTHTVTLAARDDREPQWKYPTGPTLQEWSRPGRVFRHVPDQGGWRQIPPDQPLWDDKPIDDLFAQSFVISRTVNGQTVEIRIQGDPNLDDSKITLKTDDTTIDTTIGDIDNIDKEYREAARSAVEQARQWSAAPDDDMLAPFDDMDHMNEWLERFGIAPLHPQRPGRDQHYRDEFGRMREEMDRMRREHEEMIRRQREWMQRHDAPKP